VLCFYIQVINGVVSARKKRWVLIEPLVIKLERIMVNFQGGWMQFMMLQSNSRNIGRLSTQVPINSSTQTSITSQHG
jgi:hypothetical protein